ncbi:HAD-IA family hydrolase [Burkholderia multivorans]|uniref:HAD-IA family hydrolase n=1 Tax=Burkholderia multivorans TaxID=87883 RepID=UPI001C21D964|nr:HAD-IA family hydrolase [Burkholderia multivorans]MBU9366012.1 HAD-IA family hydrolase [Burkholderia multivorans]
MALQDFKVLTFDVVGTLIDFEGGMLDYFRRVVPDSKIKDEEFLAAYRRARAEDRTMWYPDDLERCWHLMAQSLDLPDSDELAQGLRDSVVHWKAFPDSVDALKRLRKHFKLVAMTNSQRWALSHFERTLDFPFDDTNTVDDALTEKPDPQYFAYARGRFDAKWGFKQEDNLHVAQSQYHDIGVANALGLKTCWIERRHAQPGFGGTMEVLKLTEPTYHFHSLAQLADAVEANQ